MGRISWLRSLSIDSQYRQCFGSFLAPRNVSGSYNMIKTLCVLKCNRSLVSSSFVNSKCSGMRLYCTKEPGSSFPHLTNLPIQVWPGMFKTLRNSFLSNFIIQKYLDKDFSMSAFIDGSKKRVKGKRKKEKKNIWNEISADLHLVFIKREEDAFIKGEDILFSFDKDKTQAVEVVSNIISQEQLSRLEGLVTQDVINEINLNMRKFSLRQIMDLAVSRDDIYMCFPHNIELIFPDNREVGDQQIKYVQITMVYHVLRGYKELEESQNVPLNLMAVPEYEDKLFVLNYRFLRNYSEEVPDQWIINGLNHFKPF